MRSKIITAVIGVVGLLALGTPAWAVDPSPPSDPTAVAVSALANFGDKALSTFGTLVMNPWVLAIFAFGIGLSFVRGYIRKVRGKVGHGIA